VKVVFYHGNALAKADDVVVAGDKVKTLVVHLAEKKFTTWEMQKRKKRKNAKTQKLKNALKVMQHTIRQWWA
jgi:hypothetical protein